MYRRTENHSVFHKKKNVKNIGKFVVYLTLTVLECYSFFTALYYFIIDLFLNTKEFIVFEKIRLAVTNIHFQLYGVAVFAFIWKCVSDSL